MNPRITAIIDGVLKREGDEYTDRPNDSGGPTKYGITLRTLSAHLHRQATADDVRALTEWQARNLYVERFVTQPGYREVLRLWEPLGAEVVGAGVNCGTTRATEWLQRSLNALNRNGTDWPDIAVDGDCGPATVAALRALLTFRGARGASVLLKAVNALQGAHYINLAEKRPKDEAFLFGWLDHRVGF